MLGLALRRISVGQRSGTKHRLQNPNSVIAEDRYVDLERNTHTQRIVEHFLEIEDDVDDRDLEANCRFWDGSKHGDKSASNGHRLTRVDAENARLVRCELLEVHRLQPNLSLQRISTMCGLLCH